MMEMAFLAKLSAIEPSLREQRTCQIAPIVVTLKKVHNLNVGACSGC